MCVYLLKMREYFRWENGYAYGTTLPQRELGDWLTAREELWGGLEDQSFSPIEIDGQRYDPFDSNAINEALETHHLLYSAGYGNKAKPHFFLARLENKIEHQAYRIYISSKEYARDLLAIYKSMVRAVQIFDIIFGTAFFLGFIHSDNFCMFMADHLIIQKNIGFGFSADQD